MQRANETVNINAEILTEAFKHYAVAGRDQEPSHIATAQIGAKHSRSLPKLQDISHFFCDTVIASLYSARRLGFSSRHFDRDNDRQEHRSRMLKSDLAGHLQVSRHALNR